MKYGSTFSKELFDAGVSGLPFSWDDFGNFNFAESITPEQKATIIAVAAAHNPNATIVPNVVTMRQARRALLSANLLASVEYEIASMAGVSGDAARIDWEFSSQVHRDWPLIASLAKKLTLTESQVDQLFVAAASF